MAETQAASPKGKLSRKTLRKAHRTKKKKKIATDKEYAKAYFAAKSKRSNDKATAYKKRHSKKSVAAG